MGVFILISNSGFLQAVSVQISTVRTVIFGGEAIEAAYGDSQNRPSEILSAPLDKFYLLRFPGSFFFFFLVCKHSGSHTPPERFWSSVRAASVPGLKYISSFLMETMVTYTAFFHETWCIFSHISSFYHGFLQVLPEKSLVPPLYTDFGGLP